MTVLGVGFSAVLTANLAGYLIETYNVITTFLFFGIGILVITIPMALPLSFPPPGWRPAGWKSPVHGRGGEGVCDCTRAEMVRTPAFYGLWFCYFIGSVTGLMAVSIAKPVGTELIHIETGLATTLVAFFALFNGGGRPVFGILTDRIHPRNTAMLTFILIGLAGLVMWQWPTPAGYIIAFALLWGCLGGWLAIAPTVTATYFGTKDYPRCYGAVFLAYGAGAIAGPQLAGYVETTTGSYLGVFPAVVVLAVVGFLIAFGMMKPPDAEKVTSPDRI
jgi:MFS family permease